MKLNPADIRADYFQFGMNPPPLQKLIHSPTGIVVHRGPMTTEEMYAELERKVALFIGAPSAGDEDITR